MNARQAAAVAELAKGDSVVGYSEGGNSMVPLIYSHQQVTISPVTLDECRKGDIVFAKVHGRMVLHLVSATRKGQVQISNNHGRVNGWTKTVFGRVTEVHPR